jgi:hypothetical protein
MKLERGSLASLLVGLVLLLAIGTGLFWLARSVVNWVVSQDSQVAAASIAFFGTVIAGIGAVLVSQQRTKSREIAEAHRPTKTELYMGFAAEMVAVMRSSKAQGGLEDKGQAHLEEFFYDFTAKVMMRGSPKVVAAYGRFRRIGANPEVVLLVDDVLQAMRKDLGLSNSNLKRGDLIKMLLTDPESIDRLLAPKGRRAASSETRE